MTLDLCSADCWSILHLPSQPASVGYYPDRFPVMEVAAPLF